MCCDRITRQCAKEKQLLCNWAKRQKTLFGTKEQASTMGSLRILGFIASTLSEAVMRARNLWLCTAAISFNHSLQSLKRRHCHQRPLAFLKQKRPVPCLLGDLSENWFPSPSHHTTPFATSWLFNPALPFNTSSTNVDNERFLDYPFTKTLRHCHR